MSGMLTQWQVREGSRDDRQQVRQLLEESSRCYVTFGLEDLPQLLTSASCLLAAEGDTLSAFVCASVNPSGWAYLRGVVVRNGQRVSHGLSTMLAELSQRLQQDGSSHLAVYGTASWLTPVLAQAGFTALDWIVSLERHPRPLGTVPNGAAVLRPVAASDLAALAALDRVTFEPPYQLTGGELVEIMVTAGNFVVAEQPGVGAGIPG